MDSKLKNVKIEELITTMDNFLNCSLICDKSVCDALVNKIIDENEFMPTLSEIIKQCDKEYRSYYKQKIDLMYKDGFFKTDQEYGKALQWLFEDKPIIPNWLLEEISGYEEKLLISKKQIKM